MNSVCQLDEDQPIRFLYKYFFRRDSAVRVSNLPKNVLHDKHQHFPINQNISKIDITLLLKLIVGSN